MGIVPINRVGKLEFYETRISAWTSSAAGVGLTALQCTDLAAAITAARAALLAHQQAQADAQNATQAFYTAVEAMHSAPGRGADMIQDIKSFAATTDDPQVYILAKLPPPKPPSAVAPPALPTGFRTELGQFGNIVLSWKASNPAGSQGTTYAVERRTNNTGGFAVIGTAGGDKRYEDAALPAGTFKAEYRIRGQRSGLSGPAAAWTVMLGGTDAQGAGLTITGQFAGESGGVGGGGGGGGGDSKLAA